MYFRSDRNGEYNVFAYDTDAKDVKQITNFEDFPVVDIKTDGKTLLLEQAGYFHLLNPGEMQPKRLKVAVATDGVEARPRFVKGAKYVREGAISPSGARAVFEFRGEIVTVPAEKGDPRNLTSTAGVHERSPAWSPDGKSVAYFSDAGGEYRLHVRAADGKGDAKTYDLGGAGYYERATWSPDSKKIAFVDNSMSLFVIDLDSQKVTKVASEPQYGPWDLWRLQPAWSPDSKWLAYNLGNKAAYRTVFVYNLETKKSTAITDGLSDCIDPVFDASGKYLYLLSSTDAGPQNNWFAQSNADMKTNRGAYLVVLKKGVPSPLAKESDEEKADEPKPKAKGEAKEKKEETKKDVEVVIDFDGINQRVVPLPIPAGDISNLQAGAAGQLLLPASTRVGRCWPAREHASPLRSDQAQVRYGRERDCGVRHRGREQEGADREHGCSVAGFANGADAGLVDHRLAARRASRPRRGERPRRAEPQRGGSAHRPAGRVEADLRGSLADQPRLLLRPQHAWCRLEGDEDEVRGVPAASHQQRRPVPRDPHDALGTGRRAQLHPARRAAARQGYGPRRTARCRLRDRRWPLSLQEGLRRVELDSGPAVAAHRAGHRGEAGRVSCSRFAASI